MKLKKSIVAAGCMQQLKMFRECRQFNQSEILKFAGIGNADVYNPSVPFEIDGDSLMAGRVECRNSERSKTVFFIQQEVGIWKPREDSPEFELQDPFVTKVGGEWILGGVRVMWEGDRAITWYTDFYRGKTLKELKYMTSGPEHMKDIRLIELADGTIGIFSRPQGKEMLERYGCIAKIGFTVVNSIEEITPETIYNAPILEGHFLPEEWGGCNQLHILKNGLIGVIGHKAWGEGDESNRILHYYGMAFAIHPDTREMTEVKIISSRDCFPDGPAKLPGLKDVTFTAGIIRNEDGTADLYTGLSDCQVGKAVIPDPLLEYETYA